jgi:hypothetical protein
LALLMHAALPDTSRPTLQVLAQIFDTMYFASLMSEEARPVAFDVAFVIDPGAGFAAGPRSRGSYYLYMPLADPIPFLPVAAAKIAMAVDARTSTLVVHMGPDGAPEIWGLVQATRTVEEFEHGGMVRPGIFQASIKGPAWITTQTDGWQVAELKQGELKYGLLDAFEERPVRDALRTATRAYGQRVRSACPDAFDLPLEDMERWDDDMDRFLLNALKVVFERSRDYHHGGSLLITPDDSFSGLDIKYGMRYERLAGALDNFGVDTLRWYRSNILDVGRPEDELGTELPIQWYRERPEIESKLLESQNALSTAIWFVSLLTRVDGLVLLDQDLVVHGFGVMVATESAPEVIHVFAPPNARKGLIRKSRREMDDFTREMGPSVHLIPGRPRGAAPHPVRYAQFGARHRSIIRYCYQVPDSVGLIASQDGATRLVTYSGGEVLMWDGVQLRER